MRLLKTAPGSHISQFIFRSLVLSAGVGMLAACTTVNDPQLTNLHGASEAGKVKVATAATDAGADADPAVASAVTQTGSSDAAVQTADAPVLALVSPTDGKASGSSVAVDPNTSASDAAAPVAGDAVADPVLPAVVPLPMFRSTATQALLATAMPEAVSGETVLSEVINKNGRVEQAAAVVQTTKPQLHNLIGQYAAAYAVPERLVHRVVQRESRYNPAARNGPYLGLMQISHATARGMGYEGNPQGLLNANTNLRYAVKYLAGAYKVAGGNENQAVQFYARGYYYDAKRKGLLEQTGLRKGPSSIRTAYIEPAVAVATDIQTAQVTDPMITQSVMRTPAKAQRGLFKRAAVNQR